MHPGVFAGRRVVEDGTGRLGPVQHHPITPLLASDGGDFTRRPGQVVDLVAAYLVEAVVVSDLPPYV